MFNLFLIIASTALISLGALIGVLFLSFKEEILNKVLLNLVALSSGALLGGAFFHLLPEGIEKLENNLFFLLILIAFIIYFLIEKVLHWHHCHEGRVCPHSFGYMNIFGDVVHNFLDGLIIAGTFIINVPLGIITVLAIALHEIPQEIGDFGVLLYAGFEKRKALLLNFSIALTTIVGGIVGWALSFYLEDITKFLLPISGGGFIYIALSDLIPEIRKEINKRKFFVNFTLLLIGISLMYFVKFIED